MALGMNNSEIKIPVFYFQSSGGSRQYIDCESNVYKDWNTFLETNKIEPSLCCYPVQGHYGQLQNNNIPIFNQNILLNLAVYKSPSCSFEKTLIRWGAKLESFGCYASMALSVLGATKYLKCSSSNFKKFSSGLKSVTNVVKRSTNIVTGVNGTVSSRERIYENLKNEEYIKVLPELPLIVLSGVQITQASLSKNHKNMPHFNKAEKVFKHLNKIASSAVKIYDNDGDVHEFISVGLSVVKLAAEIIPEAQLPKKFKTVVEISNATVAVGTSMILIREKLLNDDYNILSEIHKIASTIGELSSDHIKELIIKAGLNGKDIKEEKFIDFQCKKLLKLYAFTHNVAPFGSFAMILTNMIIKEFQGEGCTRSECFELTDAFLKSCGRIASPLTAKNIFKYVRKQERKEAIKNSLKKKVEDDTADGGGKDPENGSSGLKLVPDEYVADKHIVRNIKNFDDSELCNDLPVIEIKGGILLIDGKMDVNVADLSKDAMLLVKQKLSNSSHQNSRPKIPESKIREEYQAATRSLQQKCGIVQVGKSKAAKTDNQKKKKKK